MRYGFIILLLLLVSRHATGQLAEITGQVSFITPENIYVRIANTQGIAVGDTLFFSVGNAVIPSLVVKNLSSTSCLCTSLPGVEPREGTRTIARPRIPSAQKVAKDKPELNQAVEYNDPSPATYEKKPAFRGTLSAASYLNYSDKDQRKNQSFRYRFNAVADNIGRLGVSVKTNITFRHRQGEWDRISENIFNGLKIYDLSIKVNPDSNSRIVLGRQINPAISGIGATDGLTFEKDFRKTGIGIFGGSRPSYRNYGFDTRLMMFGGYGTFRTSGHIYHSSTTVSLIQMMNSGKTDRRFLYLQHSGSAGKVMIYGSAEADLFMPSSSLQNSVSAITSMYLSGSWRLNRRLSLQASYDARRNGIYHETFKTYTDSLFESNLRQGFRVGGNISITGWMFAGFTSSLRFMSTDPEKSKNASAFVTFRKNGRTSLGATLSGSYLESSYLNGPSAGLSLSAAGSGEKMRAGAGYRYYSFSLSDYNEKLVGHTATADLTIRIYRKILLSVDYEMALEQENKFHRLCLQAIAGF